MEKQIEKRFEKIEGRLEKVETLFNEGLSKEGQLVKCKCGKSWITRSKALLVSCPRCGNKVRVEEKPKDVLVKCFKCKKKLLKKDAKFGYNSYFCKGCFKEYDKDSKKEVDKMIKNAEKEGKI